MNSKKTYKNNLLFFFPYFLFSSIFFFQFLFFLNFPKIKHNLNVSTTRTPTKHYDFVMAKVVLQNELPTRIIIQTSS